PCVAAVVDRGAGQDQVRAGDAGRERLVGRQRQRDVDRVDPGGVAGADAVAQGEVVAVDRVAVAGEGDGAERGVGGEVVDHGRLQGGRGELQVVAGDRGDVADPVGGRRPVGVTVRNATAVDAAVPDAGGHQDAVLQRLD